MQAERQSKSILAEEWAGKAKNMNNLRTFLCDAARVKGSTEVRVDTCRNCESQCAYGREYVKRWDAGERPMRPGPKPKPKAEEPVEAADKPVTVQPAETARLENELEKLRAELKTANELLDEKRLGFEAQLLRADNAEVELHKALVQLKGEAAIRKSQETELLKMRETNRLLSDDVKRMTLETEEKEQLNSDLKQTVASLMEAKKAAQQESQQLREANRTMVMEVKTMSAELEETRQELDRRCEQLHKLSQEHNECKITHWRLKARLYDMEHPEEE